MTSESADKSPDAGVVVDDVKKRKERVLLSFELKTKILAETMNSLQTQQEIAHKYDVSPTTISGWMLHPAIVRGALRINKAHHEKELAEALAKIPPTIGAGVPISDSSPVVEETSATLPPVGPSPKPALVTTKKALALPRVARQGQTKTSTPLPPTTDVVKVPASMELAGLTYFLEKASPHLPKDVAQLGYNILAGLRAHFE